MIELRDERVGPRRVSAPVWGAIVPKRSSGGERSKFAFTAQCMAKYKLNSSNRLCFDRAYKRRSRLSRKRLFLSPNRSARVAIHCAGAEKDVGRQFAPDLVEALGAGAGNREKSMFVADRHPARTAEDGRGAGLAIGRGHRFFPGSRQVGIGPVMADGPAAEVAADRKDVRAIRTDANASQN